MIVFEKDLTRLIGKNSDFEIYGLEGGLTLHGGGKGGGSAPPPPDPARTAEAQATANKEASIASAELNMVNQFTPYGSLVYEPRGESEAGTPQYTATQTLAPDQQNMLNLTNQAGVKYGETANQQLNQVAGKLSQPLDFTNLGPAPVANEATRNSVRDSILARTQPLMDRDLDRLNNKLAVQGITQGSEAYNDAIDSHNRAQTDVRLSADREALGQMSALYGLEASRRNSDINEQVMQRQQPINELSAMLSGSQVQGPQFVSTPQSTISPADIQGATYASYQGQLNNYNQQVAQQNAMTGGLFGLAGAGAGAYGTYAGLAAASDRRLKTNIMKIGKLANGLIVYLFNYIWGGKPSIGVMADEVRKILPHAVTRMANGYDAVDYAEVLN